jgi:hypothetical protein
MEIKVRVTAGRDPNEVVEDVQVKLLCSASWSLMAASR